MFSEIIITVTDVDAAVGFYTEVCRFVHVRTVVSDGAKVVELDADGQRVTLVAGEPAIRLVVDTANIRADLRRLNRLGVQAPDEPAAVAGGSWLPFEDPSGNALAYWKPDKTADPDER
jgi:predicted enzyme related to lactoylglutathione lyase